MGLIPLSFLIIGFIVTLPIYFVTRIIIRKREDLKNPLYWFMKLFIIMHLPGGFLSIIIWTQLERRNINIVPDFARGNPLGLLILPMYITLVSVALSFIIFIIRVKLFPFRK